MIRKPSRYCFVLALMGSGMSLAAQQLSPTAEMIFRMDLEDGLESRWKNLSGGATLLKSGEVKAKGSATAKDAKEAKRGATTQAYLAGSKKVIGDGAELAPLLAQLAALKTDVAKLLTRTVSEKRTPEGYVVEVEFTQPTSAYQEDARKYAASNSRVVVLLPEYVDESAVHPRKAETALTGALIKDGLRVYDWSFVTQDKALTGAISSTIRGDKEAVAQTGSRFLANTVLVGRVDARVSQDNAGLISYIATANIRAIATDTGQFLFSHEYTEKGFGQDKGQAARKSLEALSGRIAKECPSELAATLARRPRTMQVHVPKAENATKVVEALRKLRGVTSVDRSDLQGGAVLSVTTSASPAEFAAEIGKSGIHKVAGYQLDNR